MEIKTMPHFPVSSGEYKAFRNKLSDAEILEVLDKISDVACFGYSDIELTNPFQITFFEKLEILYSKNLNKYKSCINNGKKGGRPPKSKEEDIKPQKSEEKEIEVSPPKPVYDITCNPNIDKCFNIYKEYCKDLKPVRYERRSRDILELVAQFLDETQMDFDYLKNVCIKANEQKTICDNALDFKGVLKNHISINNEKFKKNEKGKVISKLKFK